MRSKLICDYDYSRWSTIETVFYYCVPVFLLQWLGTLSSTVSTKFLSHYHTDALAASGLTYRAFLIVLLCLNGFSFAQGVIIAKSNHKKETIAQLTLFIIMLGILLGLGLLAMPSILTLAHDPAPLVALTVPYFHWLALTCPLIAFNGLWQQCLLVYKKPIWIVAIAILYFIVSVMTNHIFILGIHGHLAYGLAGSAIGELCAQGAVTCLTLVFIQLLPASSLKNSWHHKKNLIQTWVKTLKLGSPIALRWMNEMLAMAVVAIFISYLGKDALGSFRVVMQMDILAFMIAYSMNIILAILLSDTQNKKHFQQIFKVSLSITLSLTLVCSLSFWIFPKLLLMLVFGLKPSSLLTLSAHLLEITGLSLLFSAARQIFNAALRALEDTFWPFVFSIISEWGIAVFGSFLCVMHGNHSMITLWWCIAASHMLACLLSGVRLATYKTKIKLR
jgi:Na+-driven multidrug efflux pump